MLCENGLQYYRENKASIFKIDRSKMTKATEQKFKRNYFFVSITKGDWIFTRIGTPIDKDS